MVFFVSNCVLRFTPVVWEAVKQERPTAGGLGGAAPQQLCFSSSCSLWKESLSSPSNLEAKTWVFLAVSENVSDTLAAVVHLCYTPYSPTHPNFLLRRPDSDANIRQGRHNSCEARAQ